MIRALPLEGQHLVVGGPGTGKSIIALLRTRRLAAERRDYCFLVYNHLLNRASVQLYSGASRTPKGKLACRTWNSWFSEEFRSITGNAIPLLPPCEPGGWKPVDWDSVLKIAEGLSQAEVQSAESRYLVIDEGQDMPPQFYQSVVALGFENVFVVADQNQQITEENSSRQDIQDCLDISPDDVMELRQNFRNRLPVARLAREFCTNDPATVRPHLPAQSPTRPSLSVPIYFRHDRDQLPKIAGRILRYCYKYPRHLIGVIAPNNQSRRRFLDAIRQAGKDPRFELPLPVVRTFSGSDRANVRFDEGGILVINVQACKGLEFDIVFCVDIDQQWFARDDLDIDILKKRFYVMVARARERVILLGDKAKVKNLEEHLLPANGQVLNWY